MPRGFLDTFQGECVVRLLVCLAVSLILGGCAGRRVPVSAGDRTGGAGQTAEATSPSSPLSASGTQAPTASIAEFIAKFRELSAQARPPRQSIPTVEATDTRLREALAVQIAFPTPQHMRAVAAEYRRLNIVDRAHAYLSSALVADPTDPATYDALARLWRDAGAPQLGLADAHRAVYFAPDSPEARNTLGTVLQAMVTPALPMVPTVHVPVPDLAQYDALLVGGARC